MAISGPLVWFCLLQAANEVNDFGVRGVFQVVITFENVNLLFDKSNVCQVVFKANKRSHKVS